MAIRKNAPRCCLSAPPQEVMVTSMQPESVVIDGQQVTRVVKKRVNVLDKKNHVVLPSYEEFKLSKLLAANVPLKEVPCSHLLDPTDPADCESIGVNGTINVLNQVPPAETSPEPEPTPEPEPAPES